MAGQNTLSIKLSGQILVKVSELLESGGDEAVQNLTTVSQKLDNGLGTLFRLEQPARAAEEAVRALEGLLKIAESQFRELAQNASRAEEGSYTLLKARSQLEQGDTDLYALYADDITKLAVSVRNIAEQIGATAKQVESSVASLRAGAEQVSQAAQSLGEGRAKADANAQEFGEGIRSAKDGIKKSIPGMAKAVRDKGYAVIYAATGR